ncbi:MAG TPA: hypothetical protein VGV89_03015 [Thermoplasmata archaeon]|nr:hypothetical protein [Thermoplasmata archaeon]
MRAAVVGIGVAMLVVGGVLWYLPFPTSSSANVTVGYGYVVGTDPPLALLTSSVGYTATWTSQNTTNVSVFDCGTDSSCGSQGGQVAQGAGTHGTISWSGAKGEYFDIIPNDTAEVTVTYHTPLGGGTVGLVLVGFGAVLAVVGLRSAPPPRKPEPTTAE